MIFAKILAVLFVYNALGVATAFVCTIACPDVEDCTAMILIFWPLVWLAFAAGLVYRALLAICERAKNNSTNE